MPEEAKLEIIYDDSLPVVFVDHFAIAKRSDGMFLLHLLTELPSHVSERYRAMVPDHAAKSLIDLLCRNVGYFPQPEEPDSVENSVK